MRVIWSKWGNCLGLRPPRALKAEIGVAEGRRVEVRADNGRLILEPAREAHIWGQMAESSTLEGMRDAFPNAPILRAEADGIVPGENTLTQRPFP